MTAILDADFYLMPATSVAPALCGCILCVRGSDGTVMRRRITETECYYGEEDTACHAHRGKTPRNEPLYRRGGIAYVYLCYGIHNLFNIVTGPEGHPEAVLIRSVQGAPGPGLTSKQMGIKMAHNGISVLSCDKIWCEYDDESSNRVLSSSPRIGIPYAAPEDRERLWRFSISK